MPVPSNHLVDGNVMKCWLCYAENVPRRNAGNPVAMQENPSL
jgi:hypothetical protein